MPTVLLWGFIGAALAGLLLVALGRRGRRVGDHPVCRRCNFDLRGRRDDDAVCPECACDLTPPRAVVRGERRRSALAIGGGLVLLVACGVIVTAALVGGPAVHRYKPMGLLMLEARFASSAHADELGTELLRRFTTSLFDASDRERAVTALLEIQGDRSRAWSPKYGDLLEQIGLSEERNDRYERQMVVLGARARERVAPGFPIPVRIDGVDVRAGTATNRDLPLSVHNPTVNGEPAGFVHSEGRGVPGTPFGVDALRVNTQFPNGHSLGGLVLVRVPDGVEPGPLELTIDAVVRPERSGRSPEPPDDGPWWRTHEGLRSALGDAPTVAVRRDGPRSSITWQGRRPARLLEHANHRGVIPPYLTIPRLETDEVLAHRILLVYPDGREFPAGWYTTTFAPNSLTPREPAEEFPPNAWDRAQTVYEFSAPGLGGISAGLDRFIALEHGMRLILRPDPWFAEHTLDVFEIPGGDIDLGPITIDQLP